MNPETAPSDSRQLGDFTLLEEIGRGGMGVVYRAEQGSSGRIVALKVLPALSNLDDGAVARFRREAEAARRLAHPGIVPIRAVGQANGVHFFAMDLVDGPSLDQVLVALRSRRPEDLGGTLFDECGFGRLSPELALAQPGRSCVGWRYAASCAHIVADVADALSFAHRAGVIHRDVKPSNVLLGPDGRAILVDFGLARDERAVELTRSGDTLGTPTYMAPEQAARRRDIDGRVDVYGLGVTLYELLTLRPPFEAEGEGELLRRILEDDPTPVRQLNPRVPMALSRIVDCCLAKDPDDRYPTVDAFVADLRACLEGRRIVARRPALHRRVRRAVKRHRRSASIGALVVAAAGIAAISMGLATHHEARLGAEAALGEAAAALREGRMDRAEVAYGRAAAALPAELVEAARREHASAFFEVRYAEGRFDELSALLREWPERPRAPFWDDLLARAEGRGFLDVAVDGSTRVEVGDIGSDGVFRWVDWRREEPLPLGSHLVRLRASGFAPTVRTAQVERDQTVRLEADLVSENDVPPGFVVSSFDAERGAVLIARTETSAGEYARFLRTIDDVELRNELLPEGWRDPVAKPGVDVPVRGLSFVQARTFAALSGAHLPSVEEHARAANGGLPELTWPWGTRFEWSRVAADPAGLAEPRQVSVMESGSSPTGVIQLVGNVREFVTQAGVVRAVGGHFASTDPAELRVDTGPTLPLDEVDPYTGFRLARFLAPADDPVAKEQDARICARTPGLVHQWSVSERGEIRLRVARGDPARPAELAPTRMIQAGAVDTAWPTAALVHRSSAFDLELPRDASVLSRVILPAGSHVDAVEPTPAVTYFDDGRPVLFWTPAERSVGGTLRVSFRYDGVLTDQWPTRAAAFEIASRFLSALGADDRAGRLPTRVHENFVWLPHGLGLRALLGPARFGRFEVRRFVDATAVGPVCSVFVEVDRAIGSTGREEEWIREVPLIVQYDRRDERILALALDSREDGGELDGRRYVHPGLGVELVAPRGIAVRRERSLPLELQISCRSEDAPEGVSVHVVGSFARAGETPEAALHRLTGGVVAARAARLLADPVNQPFGSRKRLRSASVSEWQIGHAGDETVSRERWHLIAHDRRWFLVRLVAEGSRRTVVHERYADARSARLLDAIAGSLTLP